MRIAPPSPKRLAWTVIAAILICQLGFAVAIAMIRSRTNEAATAESIQLMSSRLDQIQAQLSSLSADYNNWNDAYDAVASRDLRWIYGNYAMSATDGEIFDGLILLDGTIPEPWAWTAADPDERPSPSFLSTDLLEQIRTEVAKLPMGEWKTFDLRAVTDGKLQLLSATHVLPSDTERLEGLMAEDLSIAVFAETLDEEYLGRLAEALFVEDLVFGAQIPSSLVSLPITGSDGAQLGVLSWTPPRPGNDLVQGMAPVLVAMAFLNTILGGAAAWLARSRAEQSIHESAQAHSLARTDAMTGLPNRLAFTEHLTNLEARAVPEVAVLFIDLDGFKAVNDSLGHAAGDALVTSVAERLSVFTDESTFLARLGGDEFVFVLASQTGVTLKANVLTRVVTQAMAEQFLVAGNTLHVGLSQGLALRSTTDVAVEELVRRADLAMYRAKQDRMSEAQLYTPELDGASRRDREIEVALRAALDKPSEFSIVYQPVVRAKDHTLSRAEALARWTSADLDGSVSPGVFIPLAERTGLIVRLGSLLLDRVCADLGRCPSLKVCINLSPVQLRSPNFFSDLDACLSRYDVRPEQIEFEITEGIMIGRADRARQQLEALRERGFAIALDDFGTGFSSIGYLTSMPFDTLKIDQMFLSQGGDFMKNIALIRSIVHLGHTLGKTVVCEGVETKAQASALQGCGCDELQGHYFSAPMPLANLVTAYSSTLTLVA